MKRYETQQASVNVYIGTDCDGCGEELDTGGYTRRVHEVIISVDEDAADGQLDIYDYCDTCLDAAALSIRAAGSTAPIITRALPPGETT